jgi:neutral ceramidase
MICATHTHTGPLFDDVRRYYFHQAAVAQYGTDPHETIDYPAFLIRRLAEVISKGQASLRPAELALGVARQEGVAFNRRYWMKNGQVRFNPGQLNTNIVRPAGPIDPDIAILQARDARTGRPFAGATVFAMHSDTVGGTLYSADYEYFVEQTLRHSFGSNYISAFGLGTCGDINHIDVSKQEPVAGFPVAERIGRTLGQTVLKACSHLSTIKEPILAARSSTLPIALQSVSPEQVADAKAMLDKLADAKTDFFTKVTAVKVLDLERRGSSLPMEVQVFRLDGDTVIVCLPGEIFVELGLAIKHASPFPRTIVLSICNDRPSYVPTRKAFAEGSYEVTNSRVVPGTGEKLVETALELLNQLH